MDFLPNEMGSYSMNELFGIEPCAFETVKELRLLLQAHGPYTGKYILEYPSSTSWRRQVLEHFSHVGDVERERLKSILIRAKEERIAIEIQKLGWADSKDWIHNAIQIWSRQGNYKKIYVSDIRYHDLIDTEGVKIDRLLINSMDPPPLTASDAEIEAKADDYWDVCSLLCKISHVIHVVDPYFDPLKASRRNIFRLFLNNFFEIPHLQELNFWVRKNAVCNADGTVDLAKIERFINDIARNRWRNKSLNFNLIQDEDSVDKIHARYLLTNKGGIKVDQGFQELPNNRKNLISTVAPEQYKRLYELFSKKAFAFRVVNSIRL